MEKPGGAVSSGERCILCIDLDCFFAQVLLKDRADLKGKPVGIKQKYIIVTCNYEARALGITKLMLIEDAIKVLPELVILDGSDLSPFREAGKAFFNITRLTLGLNVALERKGFDEIYADITEPCKDLLSEKSMASSQGLRFVGHVFPEDTKDDESYLVKLLMCGSEIASELRREIKNRLGYNSCAGVGPNKFIAKLASNIHKPNDQTTFVLGSAGAKEYFKQLSLRNVPGLGSASRRLLKENGFGNDIKTCGDLMERFKPENLARVLHIDAESARSFLLLCEGIDDRPVESMDVLTKQISREETRLPHPTSFEKLKERVHELVPALFDLMETRFEESFEWPTVVKLTIKFRSENGRRSKSKSVSGPINKEPLLAALADDLLKEFTIPQPFAASHVNLCVTDFQPIGHDLRQQQEAGRQPTGVTSQSSSSPSKESKPLTLQASKKLKGIDRYFSNPTSANESQIVDLAFDDE